jgi:ribonuclease BN (tRNA processing enzyme)
MRLTVLGSGTMMPTASRYPSSYLIQYRDERVLLDCGHLTLARLLEMNIDLHSITAIGITHFHTDHFSGLLPLIHARWVDDVTERHTHKKLTILGPETLKQRFDKMREVMWPESNERYPITFAEGPHDHFCGQYGPIKLLVTKFPVRHVEWFPSIGFEITGDSKRFVYTGDLGPEQDSSFYETLKNGTDLLLIEAGASSHAVTHLTVTDAISIALQCNVGKILLTHIHEDRVEEVKTAIKKMEDRVQVAEDKMVIEI